MAFAMNTEAQLTFFNKVYGPSHPDTLRAKALQAAGVTFETTLYAIVAKFQGQTHQVQLTTGTTSLIKGQVDAVVADLNKKKIATWLWDLSEIVNATPLPSSIMVHGTDPSTNVIVLIKAIRTVTGLGLADAKKMAEGILAGGLQILDFQSKEHAASALGVLKNAGALVDGPVVTTPEKLAELKKKVAQSSELLIKIGQVGQAAGAAAQATGTFAAAVQPLVTPKPVPQVIHLKDALAIGQKVHGTSSGSVYHCIAVGEHIKVAARLYQGGSISIRAEWTDDPKSDIKKLEEAGMGLKGKYGSIHFDAQGVPLQRVIGAFLMGTGIVWKSVVTNGADLVIAEKV